MSTTPTPTPAEVAGDVLHGLVFAAVLAASVFVKNPNSVALAGKLSNIVVNDLLPYADQLLKQVQQPQQ